ncbi:hypothetical protein [Psychromonas sp. SP041]|uniref:hypothetical protein n=1 Tax=Psychromonas sp. SP041 TaxID=1365007 RepID=UPI000412D982|nr:hypothetical protein [Psychromonas sp. SP041]
MITQIQFEKKLTNLVIRSLQEIISNSGDSITGFGLVLDENCIAIRVAATTKVVNGDLYDLTNWEIGVSNDPVAYENELDELYEQSENYDYDDFWFEEFQNRVYFTATSILEEIQVNQNFSNVFLSVWFADSDLNIRKSPSAIFRLNAKTIYDDYIVWLGEHT